MKQKNTLVYIILFLLAAGLGYCIYLDMNSGIGGEIIKLRQEMKVVDSLNRKIIARDSIRAFQIDSLKSSYKNTKSTFKKHETKYNDTRSTITLPDL